MRRGSAGKLEIDDGEDDALKELTLLFNASGARSLFTSGPLQRQFRDAHAVNSHLAFNFDAAGTNYGRVAIGLPSENLTL